MTVKIHVSHDEVIESLPYGVICEAMEGARWNTMKRKRLWNEIFSESEKRKITEIKKIAHRLYLVTGVPEYGLDMTKDMYLLWYKLAHFCASI